MTSICVTKHGPSVNAEFGGIAMPSMFHGDDYHIFVLPGVHGH
jgi:hypothetical protein